MAHEASWLPDLAALASLSVAVHYVLGLYGLLGALLIFILLEHGSSLTGQRKRTKTLEKGRARSTSVDDELDADQTRVPQRDKDDEHAHVLRRVRHTLSHLVVRDVASREPPCATLEMNARAPVRFDTDLFIGHVLFLVRTDPADPRYAPLFAAKRRMFWIQVQGRFKRRPTGPIYLGGELPAPIAPGVVTRSVAHVIMGLIRGLVGHVRFSFGHGVDEVPAVAFPLYQSVDQFVATPEGEIPPTLGTNDFGETEAQRDARKATAHGTETYDVGPTYTFDFHTMYVDLTRWETANLPTGLNALALTSFFNALPLRLVAYQVDARDACMDRHCQHDKTYVFSFEVTYGKERRGVDDGGRADAGRGRAPTATPPLVRSEWSTMSTTVSDASSMAEDDEAREHAAFVRREHARRLAQLSLTYLCWLEEVDVASDVRRVHYVFAVTDQVDAYADDEREDAHPARYRLAIVSSYALRKVLQGTRSRFKGTHGVEDLGNLRFHSRSRIGSYGTITSEARQVVQHVAKLAGEALPPVDATRETEDGDDATDRRAVVAAQAALYTCLTQRQRLQEVSTSTKTVSPSRLGVNLSRRERQDMGVVCEGVVYRYYAAELVRQEVLLLTHDALCFYRSYASRAEKTVRTAHILGARAIAMPSFAALPLDGAYALQISTLAEDLFLLVGTRSTQEAWLRGILQHTDPKRNWAQALRDNVSIDFAVRAALRPAQRIALNSRVLFPHLTHAWPRVEANGETDDASRPTTIAGAHELVQRTLQRALHLLNQVEPRAVTDVLAFLDDASALRAVDVQHVQDAGSHEDHVAFYLNLYHTIVAHAVLADGWPRHKSEWRAFLTRTCYVVRRGPDHAPLTLSLAELEHVILRARLPQAEVPHVHVSTVVALAHRPVSRLHALGLRHPDFRLSLALCVNQQPEPLDVTLYDARHVHAQLNAVVRAWLSRSSVEVDDDTKTITLPRVCEWYRHDFGASRVACVRKLLGFMESNLMQRRVMHVMGLEDRGMRTRFHSFKYTRTPTLRRATNWGAPGSAHARTTSVDATRGEQRGGTTQL
ncbi:hypothetical protein PsorP6_009370 [Peronosclerospora sorghi]|uniref:Uncharacterized protein n=1 Tax=Peronosclerospora sorghi TaxID=230839 RepID=A0ACC0VXN6_9STRA|nr:hypothetical protein PsorP6_009370 [Peronosclerospora sorghi]